MYCQFHSKNVYNRKNYALFHKSSAISRVFSRFLSKIKQISNVCPLSPSLTQIVLYLYIRFVHTHATRACIYTHVYTHVYIIVCARTRTRARTII